MGSERLLTSVGRQVEVGGLREVREEESVEVCVGLRGRGDVALATMK